MLLINASLWVHVTSSLCVCCAELQALHEMVQQKVVTLLSDSENIVKQSLMENGITRLCVFFGRQKANDVLLSHMITFLNDKNDWHLRGAFFDSIVGKRAEFNAAAASVARSGNCSWRAVRLATSSKCSSLPSQFTGFRGQCLKAGVKQT